MFSRYFYYYFNPDACQCVIVNTVVNSQYTIIYNEPQRGDCPSMVRKYEKQAFIPEQRKIFIKTYANNETFVYQ